MIDPLASQSQTAVSSQVPITMEMIPSVLIPSGSQIEVVTIPPIISVPVTILSHHTLRHKGMMRAFPRGMFAIFFSML